MSKVLIDALHNINLQYFALNELPEIRWSKGQIKKHYRRLTLGTYVPDKNLIRIHPLFREGILPEFVRDYVIYHEMLHFIDRNRLKKRKRGRRKIHTPEFHQKERQFPRSKEAQLMIRQMMKEGFPTPKGIKTNPSVKKKRIFSNGFLFPF